MEIKNKHDVIAYLRCIHEDFRSLKDGDWVPDADSCDASMEVLQEIIDWLDMPAKATPIPYPDCFKV